MVQKLVSHTSGISGKIVRESTAPTRTSVGGLTTWVSSMARATRYKGTVARGIERDAPRSTGKVSL